MAQPVLTAAERAHPHNVEPRKATPITWWAGLGAAFLAFQLYLYGRWVTSSDFRPTDVGPDRLPTLMRVSVTSLEIIFASGFVVAVYFLLYRPWRRDGKISFYGLLVPAYLSMYWQDLFCNIVKPTFTYNSYFFNRGSWYEFIPGWSLPNANRMPEPWIFSFPAYVAGMLLPILLAFVIVRRIHARHPQLGTAGVLALWAVVVTPIVVFLDILLVRFGVYIYAGTIPSLTLFSGHYYQYPLYEILCFGMLAVGWGAIFSFRDDKGYSFVERGVDRVRATPRQRTALRFLALSGFLNVVFLVVYNLPMIAFSLAPSFAWNPDLQDRSYLRDQLCGAGTTYACPSGHVPIPMVGSDHVAPDGRLVVVRDGK
jgi:hypothetical protein